MAAFKYPSDPLSRIHGPKGYADYASYRPWLRDEFVFRCVYCLKREQWGQVTAEYDVDHFLPQKGSPELGTDYDNLLYSCHTCNIKKSSHVIPNPSVALTNAEVEVLPDGSIAGTSSNSDAEKIILVMCLNSKKNKEWRLTWIRNVELAKEYDQEHYLQLMGYPDDLPDLSRRRPTGNSRPKGIQNSHYMKRKRDELQEVY